MPGHMSRAPLRSCAAALIAIIWANSPWAESYHHLWELPIGGTLGAASFRTTLHHVINDGLMAVFFLLVGLEIKREVLDGQLSTWPRRILPVRRPHPSGLHTIAPTCWSSASGRSSHS